LARAPDLDRGAPHSGLSRQAGESGSRTGRIEKRFSVNFMENPAEELYSPASGVGTNAAKRVIVALVADKETIQRKRERLAAETYEYFWNICPEVTARWKRAMLTLPPSVLQDLAAEIKHLEAVTN
jgi:hypothetical protein